MRSTKVWLAIFALCSAISVVKAQESTRASSSDKAPEDFSVSVTPPAPPVPDNAVKSSSEAHLTASPDEAARLEVRDVLRAEDREHREWMDDLLRRSNVVNGTGSFHEKSLLEASAAVHESEQDLLEGPLDHDTASRLYNLQTEKSIDGLIDRLPKNIARVEGKLGKMPLRLDYGLARRCHLKGAGLCLRLLVP
jgi:hypothetical protein